MRLLPDLLPPPTADAEAALGGVVFAIRRGEDGQKLVHVRVGFRDPARSATGSTSVTAERSG